jgi:hypothetical protein
MQHFIRPQTIFKNSKTFTQFIRPLTDSLAELPILASGSNRPLEFDFESQVKSLVYYHLHHFDSGRHLLQALDEDDFARQMIAPPGGVSKSSFFDAINTRGREHLFGLFSRLAQKASALLPQSHPEWGDLVVVDGSLITCCLTMEWADYRKGYKKAKAHLGFDPQRTIPRGLVLTHGKADEKDQVETLVRPGQTAVMDRYYQCHADFDQWSSHGRKYVCRIKENTTKYVVKNNPVPLGSSVLSDEWVILGSSKKTYTRTPVRLVIIQVENKVYWIATNDFDLTAEQIADIYRMRWAVETFFGWWKRFMRVYHILARSEYGLTVQLLSGLIAYLLLAIYCHEHFKEKVSIRRVRELLYRIRNEDRRLFSSTIESNHMSLYHYKGS